MTCNLKIQVNDKGKKIWNFVLSIDHSENEISVPSSSRRKKAPSLFAN